MKVLFCYDDVAVDLSDNLTVETSCDVVPCGFEGGFIQYKATQHRIAKITSPNKAKIPKGQNGDLYLYGDEDSGSIWQMTFQGIFHRHNVHDEWIHEFSGKAA